MATIGLIAMLAGVLAPVGIAEALAAPDQLVAPDATAPHPRAGLWRLTGTIDVTAVDGKQIAASPETGPSDSSPICYLEDDVANFGETLQQNADSICDQISVTATDGNLFIAGSCKLEGARFELAGRGSYGATSYAYDATGTAKLNGHAADFNVSYTGKYLRPCTAAEAKE